MTVTSGTTRSATTRRHVLRTALGGASLAVAAPTILRHALGETPIKIGMPLALTGPAGEIGLQMRHGAEFWAKEVNAKGGLIGREIQLYVQDTTGDPATCVRKAQEVVERDGCRLLFGMVLSSEALAVVPKLAEWNTIFMSSDNGDGRLTGSSFVPNFFRANISGPMGTRVISLWLRQSQYTKFYALGMDYAWGHNSIGVFEDEIVKAKKDYVGDVFSPIGTKDFSTYITKIRQSGAEVCFLVLQGDDNAAFLSQAREYRLPDKVQLVTSIVDLNSIHAVGDAADRAGRIDALCVLDRQPGEQGVRGGLAEGIQRAARRVRGRAVPGLQDVAGRHRGGEEHRGRQAAPGAGDRFDRQHQGPCGDPRLRPSGGAGRLHRQGGEEARVQDPGPGDHRHLPGERDHARLSADDLQQLSTRAEHGRTDAATGARPAVLPEQRWIFWDFC